MPSSLSALDVIERYVHILQSMYEIMHELVVSCVSCQGFLVSEREK